MNEHTDNISLDNEGRLAWQALFVTRALVIEHVERALERAGLSSVVEFGVLYVLSGTQDTTIEVKELASHAPLSQSGFSRLISRLDAKGFVTRSKSPVDGRAQYIQITSEGLAEMSLTWKVYSHELQRHFSQYMTDAEKYGLITILNKVIEPLATAKEERDGTPFRHRVQFDPQKASISRQG